VLLRAELATPIFCSPSLCRPLVREFYGVSGSNLSIGSIGSRTAYSHVLFAGGLLCILFDFFPFASHLALRMRDVVHQRTIKDFKPFWTYGLSSTLPMYLTVQNMQARYMVLSGGRHTNATDLT
jgi:hypothetical protein